MLQRAIAAMPVVSGCGPWRPPDGCCRFQSRPSQRADPGRSARKAFESLCRNQPATGLAGKLARALNARCWARALEGRELDRALADCNAALGRDPRNADIRDSRGLVRLRLGDLDKSILDYDEALKIHPKSAWSLYGRGLAELRKGEKAAGETDIAAATALSPHLPEEAKTHGIAP